MRILGAMARVCNAQRGPAGPPGPPGPAGPPGTGTFGGIYNPAAAVMSLVANTYTTLTGLTGAMPSQGMASTAAELIAEHDGIYLVSYNTTFLRNNAGLLSFRLTVNNVEVPGSASMQRVNTANAEYNASQQVLLRLSRLDVLRLAVESSNTTIVTFPANATAVTALRVG